jgi:predicted MFS family arabinose efflux permease
MRSVETAPPGAADPRERLLRVLSAATFVIFFQAFMVAPIIPRLAAGFILRVGGLGVALGIFAAVEMVATLAAISLFRSEKPSGAGAGVGIKPEIMQQEE